MLVVATNLGFDKRERAAGARACVVMLLIVLAIGLDKEQQGSEKMGREVMC